LYTGTMKIGVISDTHDNLPSLKKALELLQQRQVELIVHCGDWVAPFAVEFFSRNSGEIPVKGVFGNNEGDTKSIVIRNAKLAKPIEFAERKVLELQTDGKSIACYHGEDKPTLDALIHSGKYQAIFTGHTHKVRNEMIGGVLVLNPGTTCHAADSEIIEESSVAIYDSQTNSAEVIVF
jgi:putative phosphoesterase